MKPATSAAIIALLALGAIFYSGSPVLGMTQNHHADSAENSGFGPDPLLAGAEAAKPNGVPDCLTMCQPHEHEAGQHHNQAHNLTTTAHQNETSEISEETEQIDNHPLAQSTKRHPNANSTGATASAKSSATVIVRQPQPQVAADTDDTQTTRTLTMVQQPRTIVVAQQPQPVVAQRTVTLPATGNATLNTTLGTAAMLTAGYVYFRTRHQPKPSRPEKPNS